MRNLMLSTSVLALVLGLGMASASAKDGDNGNGNGNGTKPEVIYPTVDKVATDVKETHKFSNTVTNDWSWVKEVKEDVDIDIDIDIDIDNLDKLTQVSNVQKLFGSVSANTY
ncbi:MAG: hypothetical protein ICV68_15120, partial [Pyrinomonadaceae bacterium]|nr:hypothetical protein [Pyrinomonadaceae bacterium]